MDVWFPTVRWPSPSLAAPWGHMLQQRQERPFPPALWGRQRGCGTARVGVAGGEGALREERARGAAAGRNALRRLHRAIWTRRVEPPPAPSQTHPAGGLGQAARQRSGRPRAPCCRFRSPTRVRPDEWEALFHVGRAPRGAGMG